MKHFLMQRFFDEEPASGAAAANATPPAPAALAAPVVPAAPAIPASEENGRIDVSNLSDAALDAASASRNEEDIKKILQTGEAPKKPEDALAAPPAAAPAAEDAAAKAAAAEEARKKEFPYGGNKFKTTEELAWGVINTGKPLKYGGKWAELDPLAAINEARRTGDWTKVESIYSELDKAIAAGASEPPAPGSREPETGKPGSPNGPAQEEREQMAFAVYESTRQDVLALPEVQKLIRAGIAIPENFLLDKKVSEEFMDALAERNPVTYFELKTRIPQLFDTRLKQAQDVLKARADVGPHNDRVQAAETVKIKGYAVKIGFPLKDEDLTAFFQSQLANPYATEQRGGVNFLREGALFDQWYLKNREKIEEQIGLAKERAGREQAIKDINTNGGKQPATISTSALPGNQAARRAATDKLDLTDPSVLSSLSDEELDALDRNAEKRTALRP
jgi:hypothetical protein